MKISQRLGVLTAVSALGLIAVAAIGMGGMVTIQSDFATLTREAMPVQRAVQEAQTSSEKTLAAIAALSRAESADDARTLGAAAEASLGTLEERNRAIAALDAAAAMDVNAYRARLDTVRASVGARTASASTYQVALTGLHDQLQVLDDLARKTIKDLEKVERGLHDDARAAQTANSRMIRTQKAVLTLQGHLKDLMVLTHANQAVTNRFKLTPLSERAVASLDSIDGMLESGALDGAAAQPLIDAGELRQGFLSDETGLFALKARLLNEEPGASSAFRKGDRALQRLIETDIARLTTIVDDLEIRIVKQTEVVRASLESATNPAGVLSLGPALANSIKDVSETVRGLMLANDTRSIKARAAGSIAHLTKMSATVNALKSEIGDAPGDPLKETAEALGKQIDAIADSIRSVRFERLAALAADSALAAERTALQDARTAAEAAGAAKVGSIQDHVATMTAAVDQRVQTSLTSISVIALIAMGVLGLIGVTTIRAISRRLKIAVTVADAVADGSLTRVEIGREKDEVTALLDALSRMVEVLSGTVNRIRETASSVLASSGELMQSNEDLSARTERQASHLHETVASMQGLSESSRNGAGSAQEADRLVQSTNQVTQQGSRLARQAMETMSRIREGAEEIGKITSMIDSIAFQTNILALNAAVEAARAGEQGRGFAVVAGEVRSLATKSAGAARQINEIIAANVEQVLAGHQMVEDVRHKMEEIVGGIDGVERLIGTITASAAEQESSIGEVNQVIVELEEMTQQNAAMAEQSTASATELRSRAELLEQAIGHFRENV